MTMEVPHFRQRILARRFWTLSSAIEYLAEHEGQEIFTWALRGSGESLDRRSRFLIRTVKTFRWAGRSGSFSGGAPCPSPAPLVPSFAPFSRGGGSYLSLPLIQLSSAHLHEIFEGAQSFVEFRVFSLGPEGPTRQLHGFAQLSV